ncbi:MAG: potassium transporter [Deltaproteobacteria bacterium]|nr:MAG: potassium transporter [Deltaproteobacteria bacterium]
MRWPYILKIIGVMVLTIGFLMLLPLLCSLWYQDASRVPIAVSMAITVAVGSLLYMCFSFPIKEALTQREGMAIVALGWTTVGFFGALPFYLGGIFPGFTDAVFESVSGFTTTGSSVLTDIASLPKGLLFWRSQIQWLGGMGIIVMSVAVLPFLGVGGMQLYKAEVPSPVPDKLTPRISESAMILWRVYAGISVVEVIFLLFGGMSLYDAVCHTFTTMPTGGFSTKNLSVAGFDSVYIDMVITIFMIIAGINFSLHFQLLRGRPLAFWRDTECRFFLIVVGLLTVLVTLNLWGPVYDTAGAAFRYGFFQVVSIITTTGYATADYELWPAFSQVVIFFLMFMGASAGSTGGGMKCVRLLVAVKYCYRELFKLIHPHAVAQVKLGGVSVGDDVVRSIMGFLALYILLFMVGSLIMASLGVDILTAISSVASCIGNIGPGFGFVGPAENFSAIPALGKWVLVWCMLLGRLEIYTVIILLVPEFWRR